MTHVRNPQLLGGVWIGAEWGFIKFFIRSVNALILGCLKTKSVKSADSDIWVRELRQKDHWLALNTVNISRISSFTVGLRNELTRNAGSGTSWERQLMRSYQMKQRRRMISWRYMFGSEAPRHERKQQHRSCRERNIILINTGLEIPESLSWIERNGSLGFFDLEQNESEGKFGTTSFLLIQSRCSTKQSSDSANPRMDWHQTKQFLTKAKISNIFQL